MTWRGEFSPSPSIPSSPPTRWLTLRRPWRPPWAASPPPPRRRNEPRCRCGPGHPAGTRAGRGRRRGAGRRWPAPPLRARARRAGRAAVRSPEVPHHALPRLARGARRGPHHPGRPPAPSFQPRRAAGIVERGPRRNEPRRPPTPARGVHGQVFADGGEASGGQAGPDGPGSGAGSQRPHMGREIRTRHLVRGTSHASPRPPHSAADTARRPARAAGSPTAGMPPCPSSKGRKGRAGRSLAATDLAISDGRHCLRALALKQFSRTRRASSQ